MKFKEYAIIVAGGKGTRMKQDQPKQFLEVNGLPILMHTLNAFFSYSPSIQIILVLPENDLAFWHTLCKKHNYTKPLLLQIGGASRFQSVKKGLMLIDGNEGLVAIHDGVRPLVSESIISKSFELAATKQSAIAAIPLKESIRIKHNDGSKALDRSQYWLVQTPQTFDLRIIKQAYQETENVSFTDDASVVEYAGNIVNIFEGSYENIKVTTPEDLVIAAALLKKKASESQLDL